MNSSVRSEPSVVGLCGLGFVALLLGCDRPIEKFSANQLYALTLSRARSVETSAALADAAAVVDEQFGAPNEPRWPAALAERLPEIDPRRIARAAGPVSSEQDGTHLGLYREHCVNCHGLAGSGAGPASLIQTPYPRDFRHGVFKWKSTERDAKPTRDDLRQLLTHGVPGTAMPSFATAASEDIEALIDYVVYLSIRGEVERRLIAAAVDELDYGEQPPEPQWRLGSGREGVAVAEETMVAVAEQWQLADQRRVPVPQATVPVSAEVIERGKETFHGQIAGCAACHGPAGSGAAVTLDYDDWTKEFTTRIGVTPTDRAALQPFRRSGALKPYPIDPRNLQTGVFRGGGDPETLYRRITQGIAGTPMPAVPVVAQAGAAGLTSDQVWELVHYVQSLSSSPLAFDTGRTE